MVITIRDREIAEAAWDEAASLLQGDYDDDNASLYLLEMNPHREPGKAYCSSCGVIDPSVDIECTSQEVLT